MMVSSITSSSLRSIQSFVQEVSFHHPGAKFDLFFVRDTDLGEAFPQGLPTKPKTLAEIFLRGNRGHYRPALEGWANKTFEWLKTTKRQLAAFATYFPDISSMHDGDFLSAIRGLTDAVSMASHASNHYGIMKVPIVEAVCGVVAERCLCADCSISRRVTVFDDEVKQDRLMLGLRIVVRKLRRLLKSRTNRSFAIGLELEPGATYVLRDRQTLDSVMNRINDDPELREHVGLNLDIGHMRIANVTASALKPYVDRIVHAHISDHPSMHTRDHFLGAWTDVSHANEFDAYISLLAQRDRDQVPPVLFSGAIAIELEGCNRLDWVLGSLRDLKRLLLRNNINVP
jgi:hypothetical protein